MLQKLQKSSSLKCIFAAALSIASLSVYAGDYIDNQIQYKTYAPAHSAQAKIVLYRGISHRFATMMNARLYINDKKIGQLHKYDFTEFCLTPGKHKLTTHLESSLIYADKNKQHYTGNFEGGKTYFFRIDDDSDNSGELRESDFLNAKQHITSSNRERMVQVDTSGNGYATDCKPYEEQKVVYTPVPIIAPMVITKPMEPSPAPKVINLEADGLFAFNRSDLNNLNAEGKAKLDSLITQINNANVKSIRITGYTDRLGSSSYNQMLSQKRAETIKMYLVHHANMNASMIGAMGAGSADPVVMCSQKNRAQLIKCLAPNRRFSVELNGSK
jgi:outer membrane protein OmpA-like peptidoglycan-associated protein